MFEFMFEFMFELVELYCRNRAHFNPKKSSDWWDFEYCSQVASTKLKSKVPCHLEGK